MKWFRKKVRIKNTVELSRPRSYASLYVEPKIFNDSIINELKNNLLKAAKEDGIDVEKSNFEIRVEAEPLFGEHRVQLTAYFESKVVFMDKD